MGLPLGKEQGHEAAPVAAVLPGSEVALKILEGVVRKLRFNAPQAGSCEERFVCVLQQFQDLIQTRWRRADKQISHEALFAVAEKEAVATNDAIQNQSIP